MTLQVRPYMPGDEQAWDDFCAASHQATLLHTRRFLGYHGDRFRDRSLLLEEEGRCVGLLPAAEHPRERACVVSHPGITYGGVVHQGALRGDRMLAALGAVAEHYRAQGMSRLVYKAVPAFYHRTPANDDLYALFRLGAKLARRDLSSTIDLLHRLPVSERRRRSLKKARKAGIALAEGAAHLPALWEVVADNLARKHGTQPVHTVAEITLLAGRFPQDIRCVCGTLDGRVVAGVVLFETPMASHAQYIASSEAGYDVSALDAVFEHCIEQAAAAGRRWFDFGICTEEAGTVLNDNLYRFKSEFGGGGTVHDFYELELGGMQHVA